MKKIITILIEISRGFLANPFWKSAQVLTVLALSLAINGILWYIYAIKIHDNPIPFIFASGLVILNIILGNFMWNREQLSGLLLIYTGLFVQVLMLLFIRYLTLTF